MPGRLSRVLIVAATVAGFMLALATPAFAQTISITGRMVAGGVNDAGVRWLRNFVIPEFQRRNPGVTVQLIEFGGSDEALKQQYALDLSVGRGADVLGFDGFWIPEFVDAGSLKPLAEVGGAAVNAWEGWNRIPAGLQALTTYQGQRYGIAMGTDYRMIFYRKDVFAQAGVPDPDNWQPRSWAELLDTARRLKRANPASFPLQINAGTAMGEATTMQGFYMVLLGTGHSLQDDQGRWIVRSQGILDALNFYKTVYVDEQLGDPRLQLLADGRNRTFANFRDGVAAMLVEGDWFYRSVTAPGREFAVANRDQVMSWARMPAQAPGRGLRGQDFVTISGGTGYVLNPHTRNPRLAWELLAFMNSRDALAAFQQIEPRIRVRDDVPVPGSPFLTETAAALGPLTTARPNEAVYAKISHQAQLMTERVVSGQMTPLQAMNAYADAVTELVGRAKTVDLLR
jgi:multiple sugar transport system substrate-binding protein